MKLRKSLSVLVIFSSVFILHSCKDDSADPIPTVKTKTDILTAAAWRISAATVDPALDVAGTQISDFYAQMDACDKDDLTKYESNKTGVYDEGATKCDPADPQTSIFSWTWDLSETKITEDGETYEVESLTDSELIYSLTFDGDDIGGISGIIYKVTITSKH